jgi:hypothetical protein
MSGGRVSQHRPEWGRTLIVGCGALAPELVSLTRALPSVDVMCLPATLHNRPGGIPAAVRERIRSRRDDYETVFVAYADCGTGGLLDRVLEEEGVERLPGAHCYQVFAGRAEFERLTDEEPATFFLTDFLVRNFERLVWRGLGLDRHPELLPIYFANYRRLVYLAQTENRAFRDAAEHAAQRLGLAFEYRFTGLAGLAASLPAAVRPAFPSQSAARGTGLPVKGSGSTDVRRVSRKRRTPARSRRAGASLSRSRDLATHSAPRGSVADGNRRARSVGAA